MPTEALEPPTTLALRPGTVIADRFRVLRPLASGSAYAITYLADDLTRGEPIVIKEFFPRSLVARASDDGSARPHSPESGRDFVRALRRFVIEGSILAEVAHPHVVRARGLVEANGTAYLVMDQHHSQPLSEYLRSNGGRLTAPAAGRIVQHLLTALEPLHAESIVHRDLSPRSVHVQGDGSVLLLEFSARRHLPLHATDLASGFAAFEQYGMRDIGPWTDVYAASALLYYLLTGVVPPSALDRAAGEAVHSPTALVPSLSPGLARLILRGMSLLPQQRPHVASELRRQLEASLSESAPQPARPAMPFAAEPSGASIDAAPFDLDDRMGALKLAAGGIVLPGEDRGDGLLRRLGNAASRFRRTPVAAVPLAPLAQAVPVRDERPVSNLAESERRPTPVSQAKPVPPPAPALPEPKPAPTVAPSPNEPLVAEVALPNLATALVATEERPLLGTDERLRALDLAAQLSIANEALESRAHASSQRRRYSLVAAAGFIVAVTGSLAFLSRSSGTSDRAVTSANHGTAALPATAVTTPARTTAHEVVEAGAVLQTAPRTDSLPSAPPPSAKRTRSSAPPEHKATPAPTPAPTPTVLPAGKLPNVNVAIAGPATDLKLLSPEMLVDARTRLSNGQDAADQGDYSVARRAFRAALQQLDSLTARYPSSEKVRALHREVEQADAGALQACNAENEMRTRRGTPAKACQ